jgi:hypothetical protein
MSDPTNEDELLEEIRVAAQIPVERWAIGRREKWRHANPPRVEWLEVGGSIDTNQTELTGGERGDIAVDTSAYVLTIWHLDKQRCKQLLYHLIRTIRDVVYGPNVVWSTWEWIQDDNVKLGRKLAIQVAIRMPIKATPEVATATVLHHFHEQFVTIPTTGAEELVQTIQWSGEDPED